MYEIKRHLRPKVDGDPVVVAFSISKQLKASYPRRWSTQQSYGKGPGLYHTEVCSTESRDLLSTTYSCTPRPRKGHLYTYLN